MKKKYLNLYAGLGGNRKKLKNVKVTAIEKDKKIAAVYQKENPEDEIIIADAHQFLLDHSSEFGFVWSSPPCQKNTRMIRSGKNRKPCYPDLRLYEEIIFLEYNFSGSWVIENVVPYYDPLIKPTVKIGRHLFWSNFPISEFEYKSPKNFINKTTVAGSEELKDHLGIHYEGNIYYEGNHCPAQVLRNCVPPEVGEHIHNEYLKSL